MKAIEPWHCWFRMFETAGISLDTLRPFGQGAGRRGKKKKEKKMFVASRFGEEDSTWPAQHSPTCEQQTQDITKAPQANKQGKGWPYLCLNVEQDPRNPSWV